MIRLLTSFLSILLSAAVTLNCHKPPFLAYSMSGDSPVPLAITTQQPRRSREVYEGHEVIGVSGSANLQMDINREIYEAAYFYISKTCFPNIDAGAMYLVAATSQENRGAGDPNVFSAIRMTTDVYNRYPAALASFSCTNTYGLEPYTGYHIGPLSLSPDFLNDAICPEELGRVGSSYRIRRDITGAIGDRMNWYDSCNMACAKLDLLWSTYYNNQTNRRGTDIKNPYSVVAITSMAMHQGCSVLTEDDDFMPEDQAECATPAFWFDWCNIITQEKYIDTIRFYVDRYKPLAYENDIDINKELIIPIMDSAKEDALRMRSDFFSYARYQSVYNWVTGDKSYTGYVGSPGEKTSAALKVLVSYIIMEERYAGKW